MEIKDQVQKIKKTIKVEGQVQKIKKKLNKVVKSPVYKVSPLMTHIEKCVHELITVRNGEIVYEKFVFVPEDFPCGSCRNARGVVFMRVNPLNVVVRSCRECGTTQPIDVRNDDGEEIARNLNETRTITSVEAVEFIRRNKISRRFLDPALKKLTKAGRVRTTIATDKLGLEEE